MRKKPRVRSGAPIDWLQSASAQEVGEALLAVDEAKAAEVVIYLAGRSGPELRRMLDDAGESLERDPVSTVVGMFISGVKAARR